MAYSACEACVGPGDAHGVLKAVVMAHMGTKRRPWRTVGIHMEQLMRPINVKMRRGALKLSLGARVGAQKRNQFHVVRNVLFSGNT